jgi:ribonuclease P protein component
VLAKANRVTLPVDFRTAVRRGRRVGTSGAVLHVLERPGSEPSRFGFIVTKSVGNAVTRNLVRRRLRSVSRDILVDLPVGADVVMRALPGSEQVPWATLHAEIADGLRKRSNR